MPQATREEFEAAARRVMQTAKPGLSKEEFLSLIERALQPSSPLSMSLRPINEEGKPIDAQGKVIQPSRFSQVISGMQRIQEGKDPEKALLADLIFMGVPAAAAALPKAAEAGARMLAPATAKAGESLTKLGQASRPYSPVAAAVNMGMGGAKATTGLELAAPFAVEGAGRGLSAMAPYMAGERAAPIRFGGPAPYQGIDIPRRASYRGGGNPPPVQGNFNDLPLYLQDQLMQAAGVEGPAVGSRTRSAIPIQPPSPSDVRASTPPNVRSAQTAASPRLAGKAPSLEDSLLEALKEGATPEGPQQVSMPPDVTITDPAALRQSGTFGKQGRRGQPGGYTSGRPSTTGEQFGEPTQAAVEGPPPIQPADAVGGGAGRSPTTPPVETQPPYGPDVLSPRDYQDYRAMYGSRDAASRLGVSVEDVLRNAPGPSRLPLEAEGRQLDALLKVLFGKN